EAGFANHALADVQNSGHVSAVAVVSNGVNGAGYNVSRARAVATGIFAEAEEVATGAAATIHNHSSAAVTANAYASGTAKATATVRGLWAFAGDVLTGNAVVHITNGDDAVVNNTVGAVNANTVFAHAVGAEGTARSATGLAQVVMTNNGFIGPVGVAGQACNY